jgi:hypothetical protein
MSAPEKLTDRLRRSVEEDVAAVRRLPCISPSRLWELLLGHVPWADEEKDHLAGCPRCQQFKSRVHDAIRDEAVVQITLSAATDEPVRDATPLWAIAASSVTQQASLFAAVCDAAGRGVDFLDVSLPDGTRVRLLAIQRGDRTVEPCFIEGRTVAVTLPGQGRQIVTRFGGVVIPWDDLRTMRLTFPDDGTIEIGAGG